MIQKYLFSSIACLQASMLAGCFDLVDKVDSSVVTQIQPPPVLPIVSNNPPAVFGSPSTNATVGRFWSFTPSASDPDGDALTFSVDNLPPWAGFDNVTGRLSGTPQLGHVGIHSGIQISAQDDSAMSALPAFSVTVQSVSTNNAPAISGTPPLMIFVGQQYEFQPGATDPDGDTLTFDIANLPSWSSFDFDTGRLSGTPGTGDARFYSNVVISATDGQQSASLPAFSIDVQSPVSPNQAPQISGSPTSSVAVGQQYSFQPVASDPDGDQLFFTIVNQPPWAAFDSATGRLSGIPGTGSENAYQGIVISVNDGILSASLAEFDIIVTTIVTNRPPSISGNPQTSATVDQPYSFQPGAADPDGDTLTFLIENQPAWAGFDSTTGRLSGIPGPGTENTYQGIVLSVNDGILSASLAEFDIIVTSVVANRAPSISGSPQTSATVDQLYSFQPGATDPDGDTLTYLIENQPSWAAFDATTGSLSGTPQQGDASVYADIVISVDDGELTDSLPPFSITVSQAATGSATLTWTAPISNTDGSTLTDLKAYKIYYGTSQGSYPNEIRIDNPGVTTHVIDNLSANTYFFVATTINDAEIESDYSNVATKTIN